MSSRRVGAALVSIFVSAFVASPAHAAVYHSRDEALELAFPEADRTEARNFFLTEPQKKEIEKLARSTLDSDLLTVYVGYRGESLLGYAVFDTHVVRTLPETFLLVLSPEGTLRAIHLVAFYEPEEYAPSNRWLGQFLGKKPGDRLALGRDVAAIAGSTLTSRAVTEAVRRALAIYRVLLRREPSPPSEPSSEG
ncbi:MAG: hypothetical protein KatS3mg076_2261 [Candidatus Binatia bacterium]|nr:MAG: hypothetical protein KatS3mg076_2261 [Candidatus Binatia bacterium]